MSETIYYSDNKTRVMLGDVVEKRILFKKKKGRVVYIPGISPKNKEMEYGGLVDVGIKMDDGIFVATVVDPKGFYLQKKIRFVERNSSGYKEVKPTDKLFED
jgi:hypothetical protein